jgi:hypothetical protein
MMGRMEMRGWSMTAGDSWRGRRMVAIKGRMVLGMVFCEPRRRASERGMRVIFIKWWMVAKGRMGVIFSPPWRRRAIEWRMRMRMRVIALGRRRRRRRWRCVLTIVRRWGRFHHHERRAILMVIHFQHWWIARTIEVDLILFP